MDKKTMRKLYPLLKVLNKLSAGDKNILLRYLTHDGCEGIYECVHNALTNPTLCPNDKQDLQKNLIAKKRAYRRLLKESDPVKKKQVLLQVGDGIGLILEKVVPLLDNHLQPKRKGEGSKT